MVCKSWLDIGLDLGLPLSGQVGMARKSWLGVGIGLDLCPPLSGRVGMACKSWLGTGRGGVISTP